MYLVHDLVEDISEMIDRSVILHHFHLLWIDVCGSYLLPYPFENYYFELGEVVNYLLDL